MRDVKRLPPIYQKMCELHKKCPDLRIGQLYANFERWLRRAYGLDIFFIEDGRFIDLFKEFIDEYIIG